MCGFIGIFNSDSRSIEADRFNLMIDAFAHRGPDDKGAVFIETATGAIGRQAKSANLALGFRRLSIVDLSSYGHQPMTNFENNLWLVFNGEIYNAPELKLQLKNQSRHFISTTDTEIILALYEEEGVHAFKRLNGMFAFALWDQRIKKLYLVRDRVGIKPLYYTFVGNSLLFSSEIKALWLFPGVNRGINLTGLVEHFTFQYCLEEKTLFSGINMVNPGEYLEIDSVSANKINKRMYWQYEYYPDYSRTIDDFALELRECLGQVLTRQVRSDVPVASFLSSGMDSGSITALAKYDFDHIHTFTCGFDVSSITDRENYCDETKEALQLAQILGTKHHTIKLRPTDMLALIEKVIWHLEDPRVGISYQIYAIAKKVSQYCKVVLSGTGGDELFGGYHWRYNKALKYRKSTDSFDDAYYQVCSRLVNDDKRKAFFSEEINASFHPREAFNRVMQQCNSDIPLERALYFDMHGFLRGLLLVEDKLSMAHSVEVRVPFLDNKLLELASQIPIEMKYNGNTAKRVLKKALCDILPEEVIYRRKQGFTPPDANWFRQHNKRYIQKLLLSERFLDRNLFKPKAIHTILREHFEGLCDHRFLIWSLMSVEWVHRLYFDKTIDKYSDSYIQYSDLVSEEASV